MRPLLNQAPWIIAWVVLSWLGQPAFAQPTAAGVELGERPALLVADMAESALKRELLACLDQPPRRTGFSIGHRGAGLVHPEHTREAYEAGYRMGAGTLECDVTFTADRELVCRHAQNDLATTTDILLTPLAAKCIRPFEPAEFGAQAVLLDDAVWRRGAPGAWRLARYRARGIRYWAPPLFLLLELDRDGRIVPSRAARRARAAGLDIIAWTVERSGDLAAANNGFYYQTIDSAVTREGDVLTVIDVLAREVGVRGIFSDWPATVSFYAGCAGLP